MAKKHDENKDLKSISKIAKIDFSSKTFSCAKTSTIGIHMWGKIDFLTKYCGWHLIWNNAVKQPYNQIIDDNTSTITSKKAKKEFKLTDKTKRTK